MGRLFTLFVVVLLFVKSMLLLWASIVVNMLIILFVSKVFKRLRTMVYYYILGEVLGLLFLISYSYELSGLVLLVKLGVSPFHFWLVFFIKRLTPRTTVWLLTLNKIPTLVAATETTGEAMTPWLARGVVLLSLNVLLIKEPRLMLLVAGTDSGAWLLMLSMGLHEMFGFIIVYSYVLYFLMKRLAVSFELEALYVFMKFPLITRFLVNFLALVLLRNTKLAGLPVVLLALRVVAWSFSAWFLHRKSHGNKGLAHLVWAGSLVFVL